jgi:hypothetical protein
LIQCLNQNPYNWSAWLAFGKLLVTEENHRHLELIGKVQNHWIKNFFIATIFVEVIRQN